MSSSGHRSGRTAFHGSSISIGLAETSEKKKSFSTFLLNPGQFMIKVWLSAVQCSYSIGGAPFANKVLPKKIIERSSRTLLGILVGAYFNAYLLLSIYARKSHHLCVTQKFVLLFKVISIFSSYRKLSHELAEQMGKVDYFTRAHQIPAIALQEKESPNCQENTCELDPGDEWEVVILVWVDEEKAVEKNDFPAIRHL